MLWAAQLVGFVARVTGRDRAIVPSEAAFAWFV